MTLFHFALSVWCIIGLGAGITTLYYHICVNGKGDVTLIDCLFTLLMLPMSILLGPIAFMWTAMASNYTLLDRVVFRCKCRK